ncbi:TPA: GPO family capsid scaffolding protein, partial [Salmonella enterica subsp. enterica serovar Poona]
DRQKIFTSAEFEKNYMGTGRSFLNGLALTDVPASPWTTELMFSQQQHNSIYGQPEVFSLGADDNQEETHMNQQQYDTLLNAVYNKGQQINALEARVNQYSQMLNQAGTQPQQPAVQPQPAPAPAQQFAVQPQPVAAQPQYYAMVPVQNQPQVQPQPIALQQPQPAFVQTGQFAAQPAPSHPAFAQPQYFAAIPPQAQQQFVAPAPAQVPAQQPQIQLQPQAVTVQPQQYSVQPQTTDAVSAAQFQHLMAAIGGLNSSMAGMDQKFAQLMQDTTQTPSLNPAGGNQITIV